MKNERMRGRETKEQSVQNPLDGIDTSTVDTLSVCRHVLLFQSFVQPTQDSLSFGCMYTTGCCSILKVNQTLQFLDTRMPLDPEETMNCIAIL